MLHSQRYSDQHFERTAYADQCLVEARGLLATGGVAALTVSALARRLLLTPSALQRSIGGFGGLRAILVERFMGSWPWETARRRAWAGPQPLAAYLPWLPATDEDRDVVRQWLAFRELAAGEAREGRLWGASAVHEAENVERNDLIEMLFAGIAEGEPRPSEALVDAMFGLVVGLRVLLAAPEPSLSVDRSQAALWAVWPHVASMAVRQLMAEEDLPPRADP